MLQLLGKKLAIINRTEIKKKGRVHVRWVRGHSWVQQQLGSGTVRYSNRRLQMQQFGTRTIRNRSRRWVQGQSHTEIQGISGTSGRTNGYSNHRVKVRQTGTETIGTSGVTNRYRDKQVQWQTGTVTTGYKWCDKQVQQQKGTVTIRYKWWDTWV